MSDDKVLTLEHGGEIWVRLADVHPMQDKIIALESRLDMIRSGLNDLLVHNQGDAITDADAMSSLHELFYQWFQRKDVEKHERISFEGNVADVPRYPTGPKVTGPE